MGYASGETNKQVLFLSIIILMEGKDMTLKKLRLNHNEKGFTLIELMIVIAIIGILAAIAIPNFIAYRNKSYCSAMQSDAQSVAGAIADYFSDPNNSTVTATSPGMPQSGNDLSYGNTYTISTVSAAITVTVTDATGRCATTGANGTYSLTM